jgi:hypothetical protein
MALKGTAIKKTRSGKPYGAPEGSLKILQKTQQPKEIQKGAMIVIDTDGEKIEPPTSQERHYSQEPPSQQVVVAHEDKQSNPSPTQSPPTIAQLTQTHFRKKKDVSDGSNSSSEEEMQNQEEEDKEQSTDDFMDEQEDDDLEEGGEGEPSIHDKFTIIRNFLLQSLFDYKQSTAFTEEYQSNANQIERDLEYFEKGLNKTLPDSWNSIYEEAVTQKSNEIIEEYRLLESKCQHLQKEHGQVIAATRLKNKDLLLKCVKSFQPKPNIRGKIIKSKTANSKKQEKEKKKNQQKKNFKKKFL